MASHQGSVSFGPIRTEDLRQHGESHCPGLREALTSSSQMAVDSGEEVEDGQSLKLRLSMPLKE
jgi:hypothetical protein